MVGKTNMYMKTLLSGGTTEDHNKVNICKKTLENFTIN